MDRSVDNRYGVIDAVRAAAVINMTVFHLCYDIFAVFGLWEDFPLSLPVRIWERLICITFIVISGISLNFTRRGYFRGIVVFLCGIAISAVMLIFMPDETIWFGVLSFLGVAMIVTFAARKLLCRIPAAIGAAVSLALFMLGYGIPVGYIGIFSYPLFGLPEALYSVRWLAFLGFPSKDFYSSDYFPVLPWIFLYVFGFMLWRMIKDRGLDKYLYKNVPVLGFIGRHSLIIYMAHQPVLYGICYVFFYFFIK